MANHEQQSDIYRIPGMTNKQEPLRSLETPTYDVQLSSLPKPPSRQQQSPEFQQAVNQMADRIHGLSMPSPQGSMAVPNAMLPSPTQPAPPRSARSDLVPDLWFKQAAQSSQMPVHSIDPIQQQQHRQRNTFSGNLPIQQPFNSLTITPEGQLQPATLVKTAPSIQSQHAFLGQNFSPQTSNFGVIGQNIRPPPTGIQAIPANPVIQQSFAARTIPLPQRQWAAPPPGIPGPMGEGRRVCKHFLSGKILANDLAKHI